MTRAVMREYAMSMLGRPYLLGGDDPIAGFDCSGFAQELLASVGIDPPGDQSADQLLQAFKGRPVQGVPPVGALVFYGSKGKVTHVGISIGEGLMVEAGGGGSKTTNLAAAILDNAYIRVRPINRRADLMAIVDPFPEGQGM